MAMVRMLLLSSSFDLDPRLDNWGSELQPVSTEDSDLGCSATVLRCFPIVKHCLA